MKKRKRKRANFKGCKEKISIFKMNFSRGEFGFCARLNSREQKHHFPIYYNIKF